MPDESKEIIVKIDKLNKDIFEILKESAERYKKWEKDVERVNVNR